ncbi:DNA-binding protein [Streptomyces milbemycinicus]|uniref:DNA-binding protein n=1 Tax=Streptomyces milbemycinicus TaxID=476552 RepID=UPI001B803B91|nr:DNA-binding protein [Streptomyces milbemycinicus]
MTQEASAGPQELTISDLLTLPPTTDVKTAGKAFGMGRTKAYELVRAGAFPCKVVQAGRGYRVVTADLRRVLGVQESTGHAPAA